MITFSSIPVLLQTITSLKVSNTKEEQSAVNCIKIQQVAPRLTLFTTYEPNIGTYQRVYLETDDDCFGHVGDSYLLDYALFEKSILALKNYKTITLTIEDGMLVLYADKKVDQITGQDKFTSSKSCILYPGDLLDYQPTNEYCANDNPLDTPEYLGYINSHELSKLVTLVNTHGDYTGGTETYTYTVSNNGRAVLLETDLDSLSMFSEDKSRSVWFCIKELACFDSKQSFYIEGRNLSRLINFNPSRVDNYPIHLERSTLKHPETGDLFTWIKFYSDNHYVTFRLVENLVIQNNYALFNSHKEIMGTTRDTVPWLLKNAFYSQHDKDRAHQEYLLLYDELNESTAEFIIKDSSKFSYFNRDEARVEIKDIDNKVWSPIAFPFYRIGKLIDILNTHYDFYKTNPVITLDLKCLQVKVNATEYITQWRLYANPKDEADKLSICCGAVDINELNIIE